MSIYKGTSLISGVQTVVDKSERIGQIIQSTIPLTDVGLHLLDGALIDGNGIYSAFVDYIASIYDASASYFTTEASWQDAVTNYGVCGKFVYDSVNNTVRLPKYSNKIYTKSISSTAPVVGNGMSIGLVSGTTNYTLIGSYDASHNFAVGSTNGYGTSQGTSASPATPGSKTYGITTDDTKSGIIADLANITTSLDGYYYIVIATSAKTDIEVDIDEIATDLNGKCDVDGTNATFTHIVETYVNGSSWYRVYSDGWCEQGGKYTKATGAANAVTIYLARDFASDNYSVNAFAISNGATVTDCYDLQINSSNKTVSSFSIGMGSNSVYWTGAYWEAKGYIS